MEKREEVKFYEETADIFEVMNGRGEVFIRLKNPEGFTTPKGWVPLSCAEDLITLVLTEIEGKYPSSEKGSRLFSFLKAKGSQERPQEPPPSRLVFSRSSGTFAVQLEEDALVVERSGIRRDADLVRQFRAQMGLKRPYPEPVL
ncbi:MAG: hypothetical protein Q9N26_02610, partial [Aquificota bacterium]|nr:hypothetical protein [Aquificota bacterium]